MIGEPSGAGVCGSQWEAEGAGPEGQTDYKSQHARVGLLTHPSRTLGEAWAVKWGWGAEGRGAGLEPQ